MALPAGIRFRPTDQEILTYCSSATSARLFASPFRDVICELDFYEYNPPELFDMHKVKDHQELYFMTQRRGKVSRRPSRSAKDGHWRTTAKSTPIYHMGSVIGYKRALDYYTKGESKRTHYKAHEYYTCEGPSSNDRVINKLYKCRGGLLGESDHSPPVIAEKAKVNEDGENHELVHHHSQPTSDDLHQGRPSNHQEINLPDFCIDQINIPHEFNIDEVLEWYTNIPGSGDIFAGGVEEEEDPSNGNILNNQEPSPTALNHNFWPPSSTDTPSNDHGGDDTSQSSELEVLYLDQSMPTLVGSSGIWLK